MYFSFTSLMLLICSTVPLPSANPTCASFISSLAVDSILVNIILINTLLEWLIRLIVLLLMHFLVFRFFGNGIIIDSVHLSGHSTDSIIMLVSLYRMFITGSPPAFRNSVVMLSVPGDLLLLSFSKAAITSSFRIGGSLS